LHVNACESEDRLSVALLAALNQAVFFP
jgi:hypothetical protein